MFLMAWNKSVGLVIKQMIYRGLQGSKGRYVDYGNTERFQSCGPLVLSLFQPGPQVKIITSNGGLTDPPE